MGDADEHRMRGHGVRGVVVAVVIALLGLLVPAAPAAADASAEQAFVASINRLRAERGLRPLQVDAELTAIARRWAGRMAAAGAISHNGGFSAAVTANWAKLGENVGRGPDVDDLMRAFVASPTHLANLVDAEFASVGVGVVERNGELWTAHQFMTTFDEPAPAPPPPPPTPAPAPAAAPAAPTSPLPVAVPAAVAAPGDVATSAIPVVLTSLRLLDA